MKTLTASQITAKQVKQESVKVDLAVVTTNKRGEVFSASHMIVAKDLNGYRVGYIGRETGKVEKVGKFSNIAEVKRAVAAA